MFSKADKKELKKLRQSLSEYDKKHREERKILEKSDKSYSEIQIIENESSALRCHYYTDEIDVLETKQIFHQIIKYNIPKPEDKKSYSDDRNDKKSLTENAKRILRQKISYEKRERVKLYLMVIAGITGILGALIGVISISKK